MQAGVSEASQLQTLSQSQVSGSRPHHGTITTSGPHRSAYAHGSCPQSYTPVSKAAGNLLNAVTQISLGPEAPIDAGQVDQDRTSRLIEGLPSTILEEILAALSSIGARVDGLVSTGQLRSMVEDVADKVSHSF